MKAIETRSASGCGAKRFLTRCAVLVGACSWTLTIGVGAALGSTPSTHVTNYGSFKFSGPVSGTIVVTKGTCDAATSAPDVQFVWYGNVTTLKGVSKKSIVSLELDLQGSSYGKSGKLPNSDGNPPFLTFGATSTSGPPLAFQSTSGSYITAKKGVSGNLDVVLAPGDGGRPHLVIKGTWADCKSSSNS
jgi:hypothetical protein